MIYRQYLMLEVHEPTKRYGDVTAVDHLSFTVRPGGSHRLPRTQRSRQVDDHADGPRPRPTDVGGSAGERIRLHRVTGASRRVGSAARREGGRQGSFGPQPPPRPGATVGIGTRRVDELLDLVGLTDVTRKPAGSFSLGMGQRLGMSSALLADPAMVMLDEPPCIASPDPRPHRAEEGALGTEARGRDGSCVG